MNPIKKLLIITLLALSFFMSEPKNIKQANTGFTIASDTDSDYEETTNTNGPKPYSLRTTKLM